MKEWFDGLETRERYILIGGGVASFFIILYFMIWSPFITKMVTLEKSIIEHEENIVWMREAAQKAKTLKKQNPTARSSSGGSLLAVIDRTAKSSKLGKAVKRIRPDGQNKAQVWLEDAEFDDVVRWLENLQKQQNITLETSVIEKQSKPGIVNARLVFNSDNNNES